MFQTVGDSQYLVEMSIAPSVDDFGLYTLTVSNGVGLDLAATYELKPDGESHGETR